MRLIAIAALASVLAVPAYAGNPAKGLYAASVYVQDVAGGCIDPVGRVSSGTLDYKGLSGAKAALRVPITGSSAAAASTQILTVTSGSGTTSPAGTFSWIANGVGINWNVSGDFSATIIPIDKYNFAIQLFETYDSCSEHENIALTRIGPNL